LSCLETEYVTNTTRTLYTTRLHDVPSLDGGKRKKKERKKKLLVKDIVEKQKNARQKTTK
jgi:hypothetical protein